MEKLITSDRRNRIAELIISNRSIKTAELAENFNVSIETIRKDLIFLDQVGTIKKKRGGGISTLEFFEKPLKDRNIKNYEQKKHIANESVKFVKSGSVIFLDSGSTVLCLAKLLYLKKGLTIITNSLEAANILVNSSNTVYLSGGEINSIAMSLEGFGATNFLKEIKVDIAFLGSTGFKGHDGPTSMSFTDADVKKTIINNASLNIVLSDSSKSRATAFVKYASWKNIDYLITDKDIEEEYFNLIKETSEIILV